MIQPAKEDVGRLVIYKPTGEEGGITSFNERFAFVRFRHQHPTAGGQACKFDELRWSIPKEAGASA